MIENAVREKIVEVHEYDLIPLLYFIMNKFDFDSFHHSGTSGKADLLGGFIDRWINRISESLIFDKLLLSGKKYRVINDYFLYDNKSQKNAPDVLGIRGIDDKEPIIFSKYIKNSWAILKGMPSIEVKTYKKNDYLVTVRTDQMDLSKFFVLVEYELGPDYLKAFFKDELFDKAILEQLKMNPRFIGNDPDALIEVPYEIEKFGNDKVIGKLRLIGVVKGKDLINNSYLAEAGEDVRYVKDISEIDGIRGAEMLGSITRLFKMTDKGLFIKKSNDLLTPIGIKVENPNDVILIKDNKNSFYVYAKMDSLFNGKLLKKGKKYLVETPTFSRSSGWDEYIAHKNTFFSSDLDSSDELIKILDSLYYESH